MMMTYTKQAYSSYREYLQHPKYISVRNQAILRDKGKCVFCGESATEVHHLRYPRWGLFDTVENLASVCHECHCVIEGKEK